MGASSVGKSAAVHEVLVAQGAVPRFVASRIGPVTTADGVDIDADVSMENEPGFFFDALVIADGDEGVAALDRDAHTLEFIKDQYRHCKTIMVIGATKALLASARVSPILSSGDLDPGIIMADGDIHSALELFIKGVQNHRHPMRETDPPMVLSVPSNQTHAQFVTRCLSTACCAWLLSTTRLNRAVRRVGQIAKLSGQAGF